MHFLSLADIGRETFLEVIEWAAQTKKQPGFLGQPLLNKHVALLFDKPSTRTRISFQVGIKRLGGSSIVLSRNDLQISRGESIEDTIRVFCRYLDGLMVRTYKHETLEQLASYSSIPVINGLTDLYHPCQALADFQTIKEGFSFDKTTLLYVGDADNNVCHSLILAAALAGVKMHVASPEKFSPDTNVLAQAEKLGGQIEFFTDPLKAARGVQAIYTDVWVSMGQEDQAQQRKELLRPFQVNEQLVAQADSNAIVLHCLPANKGEEISEQVFESKHSRIFDQAENRLHAQMAMLKYIYSN